MSADDWLRFAAVAIGTAFAIWTGYMHASLKFESKAARLAFKRRDDALGLWRSAFHDPRKALDEALGVLYRNNDGTLAKAIESAYAANTQRYETHLANDRTRATRLHRRAQKAEGLLARRDADLTKARARASRMHRRAQQAEGALRRLKMKLIKRRVGGVLSAEDFDAVAVMSHEERPAWVAHRAEELGIAHLLEMPPIRLEVHWTRGDRPAFDVVPAAKPLSDATSQTERLAELVGNPTFMSEPEEATDTSGLTREDFALLEEER